MARSRTGKISKAKGASKKREKKGQLYFFHFGGTVSLEINRSSLFLFLGVKVLKKLRVNLQISI
jgi:hypothetical protein